jgi:hypothetical protein
MSLWLRYFMNLVNTFAAIKIEYKLLFYFIFFTILLSTETYTPILITMCLFFLSLSFFLCKLTLILFLFTFSPCFARSTLFVFSPTLPPLSPLSRPHILYLLETLFFLFLVFYILPDCFLFVFVCVFCLCLFFC